MRDTQQQLLLRFVNFNTLGNCQLRGVAHIKQRDVFKRQLIEIFSKTLVGIVPENDAIVGKFCFQSGNKFLILQGHNPMLLQ